jgi:hypothetical protein
MAFMKCSRWSVKMATLAAVTLASVVVYPSGAVGQALPATDAVLTEARQTYEATNYEHTRELLDSVIAGFGSTPSQPDQRQVVVAAYELRGRTRFNLKDLDGARTDFRAMLLLDPSYLLSAQVGPRVLALFEEVKKTTVGSVALEVTPADALVMLDEARIAAEVASLNLVGGTHTITASRTGFASLTQSFTVIPGTAPQRIAFALDRVSSTLALLTSPANVEVIIDGVSRGVTELDAEAKVDGGGLLSKRFLIADLQNGRHRIGFHRECFIDAEQEFDVSRPSDYKLDAVKLVPATASVTVDSNAPAATVFVDDAPRGAAPLAMNDICQGQHTVEVRTPFGRHLKRMDLKPGQREVFQARVRPAFAIVSDSGAAGDVRGGPDLRLVAENALQDTSTITLFAPSDKRAAELLAADHLPVDWLAFDLLHRPMGKAATIGEPARVDIAARQAKALGAQGIAAIARDPGGDPADMLLILMSSGSAEPDVIRWRMDNQQSIREIVRRLDQAPQLFRSSIGVTAIDVQDVDGAVIAAVNTSGSAEAAGIRPGDTVVGAGGSPVSAVVQLLSSVDAQAPGKPLSLDVRNSAGMMRKVDVAVQAVPNVVSLADQGLLSNKLALEYGYRTAAFTDPLDEISVRLNVAAVALRLRNRADAARELDRVMKVLADGRIPMALVDAITGTTQYLLGIAAEATGDTGGAQRAWRLAAQSRANLLVDNGEPLKDLAEQRLNELTASGAGGRP